MSVEAAHENPEIDMNVMEEICKSPPVSALRP
jgi:hypothetical protein